MPPRANNNPKTPGSEAFLAQCQPPLKWAGGKRWQLPYLHPYWKKESHRRLVEPFCGGLAAAFGLRPESALLNDVNPHLINFYRYLASGFEISTVMTNSSSRYYKYRRRFNRLLKEGQIDSPETAALFYYLNRTGFNGLCRFNRSGWFNVPFGRHKTINYQTNFGVYKPVVRNWKFSCKHFAKLKLRPDDFIYADPPYDDSTRTEGKAFTDYSTNGFTWKDQVQTAEWLSRHPGPVILTNHATPRIVALYKSYGFKLSFLQAPRRISCNGDRTPAPEVLAIRNLTRIRIPTASVSTAVITPTTVTTPIVAIDNLNL